MTEEEDKLVAAFRQIVTDELLPQLREIRHGLEALNEELRNARTDSESRRMIGL